MSLNPPKLFHINSNNLGTFFKFFRALVPCKNVLLASPKSKRGLKSSRLHEWARDISQVILMVHNLAAFIAGFFLLLCGVYLFACRLSLVRSSVHLGNSHLMLAAVLFIYGLMLQYMSVVGCYGVLKLDVTCLACFTKMTLLVAIGGLWLTFKYQDAYHVMMTVFTDCMANYRSPSSPNYSWFTNNIVDLVQTNLECCGLNDPYDWPFRNYIYLDERDGLLPPSCTCDRILHKKKCRYYLMPYHTKRRLYHPINQTSWSMGCVRKIQPFGVFSPAGHVVTMAIMVSEVAVGLISWYLSNVKKCTCTRKPYIFTFI